MRSTRALPLIVLVAAMIPVVSRPAAAAPTANEQLQLTPVVSGISTPVDLRAPAGDARLYIAELQGRIRIFRKGNLRSKAFLDIRSRVSTGGERGLLGLDFHPDYDKNGLFYVYYTDNGGDVRISEFEVTSNANIADAGTERILLEVNQPATNHNGGGFGFGPDGYLYIALGDGGGGGDPGEHGQNSNTLLGSLLRIDVDRQTGGREYAIPPGNPFRDGGGKKEVYAYGLRNPWRISIDHHRDRVYIGDVGQDRREEIDVVKTDKTTAVNFGWDVMEGSLCFEPSSGCNKSGKRLPILEYANPSQGVSVIGGYVYRGHTMPWLRGTYFYSDLGGRRLKSFRYENGIVREKTDWTSQVGTLPSSVYSFGQDGLGELYVLSGSTVYRIEPADPARCDFNGDGDDDLPVGVPGEDVGAIEDAGSTMIFPTQQGRPGTAGDEIWHQDDAKIKGVASAGDELGSSLACGDFDADGYDDLAIGVPGDRVGGARGGAVNVLYGSSSGLSDVDQYLHQGSETLGGSVEDGDLLGASLAADDFDGDGYDDLAIGAPGEDIGNVSDAGLVYVVYGSSSKLDISGADVFHQDTPKVKQKAEAGDRFGAALAAGDFDGNGYIDLAVGVPGEGVGGYAGAGVVQIFPGKRSSGITTRGDQVIHQGQAGVKESPEPGDGFGASLAAGPVDADGYDDLAVGVPGESVASKVAAGMVHYFPGSRDGVTDFGDRLINQDLVDLKGSSESGDGFGSHVAVGDIDGDGHADLVAGIPGEDVLGVVDAGAVAIVFGGSDGLTGRDQLWHQDDPGVANSGETGDRFGARVALLDFEKDRALDLVVGVPGEDRSGVVDSGDTAILFGRDGGVVTSGNLRLSQGSSGAGGTPEVGDRLGGALP